MRKLTQPEIDILERHRDAVAALPNRGAGVSTRQVTEALYGPLKAYERSYRTPGVSCQLQKAASHGYLNKTWDGNCYRYTLNEE